MPREQIERSSYFRREEEVGKRKALFGFVLFGATSNFGAALAFWGMGLRWLALQQLVFFLVGGILAWKIRGSSEPVKYFGKITAFLFVMNVLCYLLLTGGIGEGEALLHFTIFPTLFIYFLEIPLGALWSVGAFLFVLTPIVAFWTLPGLPVLQPLKAQREVAFASILFIYCAQLGLNLLFQRNRMRRIRDLEELNAELDVRLQIQDRLEREREDMSRQILHASKLAAIGELASAVAHEINNPLMIATENNGILRSGLEELGNFPPEFLRYTEYQSLALERIRRIVSSLRNFSRMDGSVRSVFDVHQAILESVSLVEGIYNRQGLRILTELDAQAVGVHGNAGRFNQVIVNLLANARDAILSAAAGRKIEPEITVSTRNEGARIVISVSDNGGGVPPSIMNKIFDPFFTTKDPGRGTGLGLSLSSAIVTEMKGELRLAASSASGATFTISLPLDQSESQHRREPELPESVMRLGASELSTPSMPNPIERSLRGVKVLIVEDEEMIAELLREAISTREADCEVFPTAERALERLAQSSFHAIISDMNLPGMSGREFLGRVSGEGDTGAPEKILISGNVSLDAKELKSEGITLLLKPFDVDQLLGLIERIPIILSE